MLAAQPLAHGEPIYAVDASVWMRSDAATSPGRAIYSHPSRHSAGQPVVAGWAYHGIAQLSFVRESWTAPVSGRRLEPHATSNVVAGAEQITALLGRLPADGPLPWLVFDAGYDPVQVTQALGAARAAILVRLRAGRCFSADPDPDPATAAPPGRPRRQERKFDTAGPQTWPAPDGELIVDDEQYGQVRVRAWAGLHPKTQGAHARRDAHGRRPVVRGTLLLVEVGRLPQQTRAPQALWLWWPGPADTPLPLPDLDRAWRAYVRRCDREIVCRHMTKAHVLAGRRSREHGADRDVPLGAHDPVDKQFDALALLLEGRLGEPSLHALAERRDGRELTGEFLPLAGLGLERRLLLCERQEPLVALVPPRARRGEGNGPLHGGLR